MPLPNFNQAGVLPSGDYVLSLSELRRSELVRGFEDRRSNSTWDEEWRLRLVDNLAILVGQLRQVGILEIFVDGSFVEDKDHPHDIDGYFDCDLRRLAAGELQRELNLLDPFKVWTWDPAARRPYRGYGKKQLPMWHRYRVELYPHYGQPSGLRDEFGHELEFPAAFRRTRSGQPKGIVKIGGLR